MFAKLFGKSQKTTQAASPKLDTEAFKAQEAQFLSQLNGHPDSKFMVSVMTQATDFLIKSGRIPPHEQGNS